MIVIDEFKGQYSCFSNFYPRQVKYKDKIYKTKEHAYQCQKATNQEDFDSIFNSSTPFQAKQRGKQIQIKKYWNQFKVSIMKQIVLEFFKQHGDLKDILLSTNTFLLIEGNHWNDTFWGVCNGVGENHLGKILMEVREILRQGSTT